MNITIINDCRDANAAGRQIIRASALLGIPATLVGVSNDLEAGGNLVDSIDALGDDKGVILVNVAPRNGKAKKWGNGAPFCYFWFRKILVISSIDGFTLSLIKKLHLIDSVNVLDISVTLNALSKHRIISSKLKRHINDSQFRSYDFLPRVAVFLLKHKNFFSSSLGMDKILDAPSAIWWIDNFGNCKTTLLLNELNFSKNSLVKTKFGRLLYCPRLKDVPDKTTAFVTGSSGFGNKRFIEIVTQGDSAAKCLGLSSSDLIFI